VGVQPPNPPVKYSLVSEDFKIWDGRSPACLTTPSLEVVFTASDGVMMCPVVGVVARPLRYAGGPMVSIIDVGGGGGTERRQIAADC